MKKTLLVIFLTILSINCLFSQEWLTSLEIAKTLARIQNKMILAVWEDAAYDSYPIIIKDPKEGFRVIELFADNEQNKLLWKYFVPVLIPENNYEDIIEDFEVKRNFDYMQKFNDDTIKIMDANGNILNTDPSQYKFSYSNLSFILENYALDTSFLKKDLENYCKKRNFNTSYRLASKYLDFAIYANMSLGIEIAELSDIYMQEAISKLENSNLDNKLVLEQKISLLKIKKFVVANNPKKALRMLKKFDENKIHSDNRSLFAFLNYASYRLLNNIEASMEWQNEVSLADLKKIKFLLDKT